MYKENKTIELCDCDYRGYLKVETIFVRFGEIATIDAYQLGYYRLDMANKYGWIVSKQTLKLNKPIQYLDEITYQTDILQGTHVIFPRSYHLYQDNKVIGECISTWTLFDLKRRRFIKPEKIGIIQKEANKPDTMPKTLFELETYDKSEIYQVKISDIDTNKHMNNTKYIRIVLDMLDKDIYNDYYVSEISINYKKEIAPNSKIEVSMKDNHPSYYFKGYVDNVLCFLIELNLKKIENPQE